MTIHKLFRATLITTFTLSLAGIASARRPPALVKLQEDAERVVSTCPQISAGLTSGYREMFARVDASPRVERTWAAVAPSRKMGDHIVLVCAGGEIHQGSGYRDFPARMQPETNEDQFARAPRSLGGRDL